MSRKMPPEVKEKRALLGKERYFKLLTEQCAEIGLGVSRDLVCLVHMASLKVIGQELNRNGVVRIPHVGTIVLAEQASRPAWCGKMRIRLPARKVVKMIPDYMLRRIYNAKKNYGLSVYRHTRKEALSEESDKIQYFHVGG